MTWLKLTSDSPGAPELMGVNGSLCGVLDWALPQSGWAIEFSAGNARVYRPGTGCRRRLHVNHDSANGSAARPTVRGCESATSATALVDAFPAVSQQNDTLANWHVSTTVTAIARPWVLYLSEAFIVLFVNTDSSPTNPAWSMGLFGDVPTAELDDEWGTVCLVRNSATTSAAATNTTGIGTPTNSMLVASQQLFWCRSIDGSTKSTYGGLNASGTAMGQVAGAPAQRGGWRGRLNREKVRLNCLGSSITTSSPTLSFLKRGSLPHIWAPLHNGRGTVTSDDAFTDTQYNPAAIFRVYASTSNTVVCALEETDTWGPSYG